jgi:gluconate 5-dehydrogenase
MGTANLFDLTGRVALVTGSGSGLGFAMARGLAEAGARVILNGRNAGKLEQAVDRLRADGLDVRGAVFDVADAGSVRTGVAEAERRHGAIGVLVNNAGIQHRRPLDEFPLEEWRRLMSINLDGVFHCAQAVLPGMKTRGGGKIINICSVMSELGRANIVPYTASKGAVRQFTRGLATEVGRFNIQVNGIAPGYFATEMNTALINDAEFNAWVCRRTPAGRWADPAELAGAAVFLASAASNYVNGHVLYVDGGITASV